MVFISPNDDGSTRRRGPSGQRVDPEKQAAEDAAAQAAKGTEREKDRRPGETDEQYNGRMERIMRRSMTGAEVMARDQALQKIALEKELAQPVIGELTAVNTGGRSVVVTYSASHYKMPGNGSVQLNAGHVYRVRTDGGAADLTRQMPNRPAVPLKRVAFDTIKVGQCGELVYIGGHPMGYKAVENWILIIDDTLTTADVEGTNKTQPNAVKTSRGVVEGVRGMGDGTVTVTVKLDDGGVVSISMLPDVAPAEGQRGVVSYDGSDPIFTADA